MGGCCAKQNAVASDAAPLVQFGDATGKLGASQPAVQVSCSNLSAYDAYGWLSVCSKPARPYN